MTVRASTVLECPACICITIIRQKPSHLKSNIPSFQIDLLTHDCAAGLWELRKCRRLTETERFTSRSAGKSVNGLCLQMKSQLSKTTGSSSTFNISFMENVSCECLVICIHHGPKSCFGFELMLYLNCLILQLNKGSLNCLSMLIMSAFLKLCCHCLLFLLCWTVFFCFHCCPSLCYFYVYLCFALIVIHMSQKYCFTLVLLILEYQLAPGQQHWMKLAIGLTLSKVTEKFIIMHCPQEINY